MDLALIGNCAYQALIDSRARVRWLCWPRFDSSFVFGGLLDEDKGGEFLVEPATPGLKPSQAYVPSTNILRTEFRGDGEGFSVIDFAPRFLQFERSFKPTMLVRIVRRIAGEPSIRVSCRPVYDYGRDRPSYYLASNHIQWLLPGARLRLTTNAPLSYVGEGRPFSLDRDIYLVLTWGEPLEAPLEETCSSFFGRTTRYWETWVKHCAIPQRFQEPVIRSALALKLHQFEDTGAITAATTTSIPESAHSGRNWDYRYCWLRDACFTLGALRRLSHFEEMEAFVAYLHQIGEASPRQLQPVYGIAGESDLTESTLDHLAGFRGQGPVRIGNQAYAQQQHDVYGEMIASIAPMFLDVRFADRAGPRSTSLVHRLLGAIEAHLESPDAGLWEKRQAPCLYAFSVLMHWLGAYVAGRIGQRYGDEQLAARGEGLAQRARRLLDERFWRPREGFFADSAAGSEADASLLLMVNLGVLAADDPRALSHVDALADRLTAADHLLYRYRHDDGIGPTHGTFTVCGFWYAEALARLGRFERAEAVFRALLAHRNHVGLLSEDIDPATGELWGNFPQTYSHVGVINAAFAISPTVQPFV